MPPKSSKKALDPPVEIMSGKRQRKAKVYEDAIQGDALDEALTREETAVPQPPPPRPLIAPGTTCWVVSESMGEGDTHVLLNKTHALEIAEGLVYDSKRKNSGSQLAQPFRISQILSAGDPVWITYLADGGCLYDVGGVFASEAAASASANNEMEIMQLNLE